MQIFTHTQTHDKTQVNMNIKRTFSERFSLLCPHCHWSEPSSRASSLPVGRPRQNRKKKTRLLTVTWKANIRPDSTTENVLLKLFRFINLRSAIQKGLPHCLTCFTHLKMGPIHFSPKRDRNLGWGKGFTSLQENDPKHPAITTKEPFWGNCESPRVA